MFKAFLIILGIFFLITIIGINGYEKEMKKLNQKKVAYVRN